jgi:LytS/YehU family sensor histidine kinase
MQLNPHFIFNALTAIQNYILSGKDVKQATRYLTNFARVMRAFLEYNQEELISLEKETSALELYIGMQKMRFEGGFEHRFNMDDALDPNEVMVPPMLIQPFVENSVEHGLRNLTNGELELSYMVAGEELRMTVTDNGHGRSHAGSRQTGMLFEKRSLATKITEERIALLNAQNGGKNAYRFSIDDLNEDGSGTIVTFTIPLIYQS